MTVTAVRKDVNNPRLRHFAEQHHHRARPAVDRFTHGRRGI
jgi:hypothetical protein